VRDVTLRKSDRATKHDRRRKRWLGG
jgi:hypothetical protein